MFIDDVRLGTPELAAAVRFYRDVLELTVAESETAAIVTVGHSTITLVERARRHEFNHLAFTIPRNRFEQATTWLAARVEAMRWGEGETELRLGEPWNSESVYFRGPDGIILELITRQHLDNAHDDRFSSAPFSSAELLCVSEVGLATPRVAEIFAEVRRVFDMETFAGESSDFTTVGDQDGLLILVTEGRPWFPTDDVFASTGSLEVRISGVASGTVTSPAGWTVSA